jgi:hypothetical protein
MLEHGFRNFRTAVQPSVEARNKTLKMNPERFHVLFSQASDSEQAGFRPRA